MGAQTSTSGSGVGTPTFDLTLSIASIAVSTAGTGYTSAPTVTLGGAGLAGQIATAALSATISDSIGTVTVAASPATGATVFPTATLSGGGGSGAAITVTAEVFSASVVAGGTSGYAVSDTITIAHAGVGTAAAAADVVLTVASVDSAGKITSVTVTTAGAFTAITDITAVAQTSKTGSGVGTPTFDLTLSIASIAVSTAGTGYTSAPTVTLGGAGLAGQIATAVVMSDSNYGDSACTASLAAGSSCQPVCDAGYNANNALVCVANSALDTVTVAAPPATGATEFPTATLSGGGGQGGELAVTAQVFSASVVHGGDSGYAINDVITISH